MSALLERGQAEALSALAEAKETTRFAQHAAAEHLVPGGRAAHEADDVKRHLSRLVAIADALELSAAGLQRPATPIEARVAGLVQRDAPGLRAVEAQVSSAAVSLADRADADIAAIVEDVRRSFEAAKQIHDALEGDSTASHDADSTSGSPGMPFGARLASFRV